MIKESELLNLGFRSFTFGPSSERDGKIRFVWIHSFGDGNWITIRLLKNVDKKVWLIDSIKIDGTFCEALYPIYIKDKKVEDLLDFIRLVNNDENKFKFEIGLN